MAAIFQVRGTAVCSVPIRTWAELRGLERIDACTIRGMFEKSPLAERVIGLAIEIHRTIGPGLLENAYQHCMIQELRDAGLAFASQVTVPLCYKGSPLDCGYRLDLIVANELIVEVKSIERLLPIHTAQVLTYLRLMNIRHGLLLNFNMPVLKDGMKSILNTHASNALNSHM